MCILRLGCRDTGNTTGDAGWIFTVKGKEEEQEGVGPTGTVRAKKNEGKPKDAKETRSETKS